jgi:hypothetical protein
VVSQFRPGLLMQSMTAAPHSDSNLGRPHRRRRDSRGVRSYSLAEHVDKRKDIPALLRAGQALGS